MDYHSLRNAVNDSTHSHCRCVLFIHTLFSFFHPGADRRNNIVRCPNCQNISIGKEALLEEFNYLCKFGHNHILVGIVTTAARFAIDVNLGCYLGNMPRMEESR
jgi:hypothetical protein